MTDLYAGPGSLTNWSALGGGPAGLNAETDYFIQGTGMTSKNAFASARRGMIFDSLSDRAAAIGTNGAVLIWTTHTTPNSLDTIANGGITLLVGSSSSVFKHWYVAGSDTITFLQWVLAAVNPSEATDEADAGSPTAIEQFFGILFDLPSGGPTKGAPNAIDAIRVGRCDLIYEFGNGADPEATFALAVADKGDVTNRLGLIQEDGGAFFLSGLHQFGTATNALEFLDAAKTLFWRDHPAVTAPFNTLEIDNASSIINLTNISWKALGTKSPGTWLTTADATVNLITCNFTDWGAFTFDSNTTVDICTFLGCGLITAAGADLAGSSFLAPTVAADEGAIFDDRTTSGATDLTEYTDTTFSQGINAHHAMRFGVNVDDDLTLTGVDFSGFSSSDDNDGSIFRFDATGGTLNLNLIDCTNDGSGFTVDDSAGIVVTVVINPVTTKITVEEADGTLIENARVFLETGDDGGGSGFPFEAAVSTLTQSAGTATLTASAVHGLDTGDIVVVRGAGIEGYNKQVSITVTSTTVFTYSVDSGLGSPAGGTPIFSYVPIQGLTNASGVIQSSKTWPASQSLKGWARKSTAAPFFKQTAISIADASGGTDLLLALQPD